MSGIEIPAPDQDFYIPKNVPHGQISECYYLSDMLKKIIIDFMFTHHRIMIRIVKKISGSLSAAWNGRR